ncbi:MAG TPA: M64 family metallopeptidase [Bacteroidota bacterium]|nr:M64 family metallopeptidase [Bacteroidota bacterium]
MKRTFVALIFLAAATSVAFAQYSRFFTDKTMRVDLFHTGTKGQETISLDRVYEEGEWPGTRTQLIDPLNLGEYIVRVYDLASAQPIFSRGFSAYFNEWQSTDEALSGTFRTFQETVRFPFPKNPVQVTISRRDKQMLFHEFFSTTIDPNAPAQVRREPHTPPYKFSKIVDNGSPQNKVDLLILPDGYTSAEMEKFHADAKHVAEVLLGTSPFKEHRKDFNVWTIDVTSNQSGIDYPGKGIWRDHALGTTYDTFGSARYVLTEENRKIRDIASAVPYDAITILVNDNRYGGGGIYNLYLTTYTKPDVKGTEWQTDYMYVHEFGHSFAGLGDEYYTSQVSYNDFYSKGIEPWEPNLTALNDPANLKWKALLTPGTPLPTPWEKAAYDSLEAERGKLNRLAPDYYEKREPLVRQEEAILKNSPNAGKVGAFEGAGYVSKGVYRPAIDCRMFSLSLVDFDPVCRAAVERMIEYYVK